MEITITRITEENAEYFEPLMPGYSLDDYQLCVGAIADGTACGVCLFDFLGGALILDYIYVAEKFRRNRIATTMISNVKALAEDIGELPIHVNYCESSDDLHGLFMSLGFLILRDGTAYRVPVESFLSSKAFSDMLKLKSSHKIKNLARLTKDEKLEFKGALYDEGCDPDILDNAQVSKELSFFAFNEKSGSPESCLLCRDNGNTIVILYMFIFKKDAAALVSIIRRLKDVVTESRDIENCELQFVTMDKKVEAFAKKMVGDEELLVSTGSTISAVLA